jgi:dihydroflavonol-4-reductase|tara:strand:- start:230 stop:1237 length:1008 start_codon:yes stop_codon:yes gene_type:complete
MDKVLVTGASGYIALHCISELLKKGYAVKGSLRNLDREEEVRSSIKKEVADDKLEFCKLNLLSDDGWQDAMQGCDYLLHMASPFITYEPKNEDDLIRPAEEGTLRALKFAKDAGVKKVVLTSSVAAIAYGHEKSICGPSDWSDINQNIGAYTKSKTIAERAAWNFINSQEQKNMTMTTIHPGLVLGPLLSNDIDGASADIMNKLITGQFPGNPNLNFTIVDVRDVALLHVKAISSDESNGKRCLTTSKDYLHMSKLSSILREGGYKKAPSKNIPNFIVKFLALFSSEMKGVARNLDRKYEVDISETISLFNWKPIEIKKTILDMAASVQNILENK